MTLSAGGKAASSTRPSGTRIRASRRTSTSVRSFVPLRRGPLLNSHRVPQERNRWRHPRLARLPKHQHHRHVAAVPSGAHCLFASHRLCELSRGALFYSLSRSTRLPSWCQLFSHRGARSCLPDCACPRFLRSDSLRRLFCRSATSCPHLARDDGRCRNGCCDVVRTGSGNGRSAIDEPRAMDTTHAFPLLVNEGLPLLSLVDVFLIMQHCTTRPSLAVSTADSWARLFWNLLRWVSRLYTSAQRHGCHRFFLSPAFEAKSGGRAIARCVLLQCLSDSSGKLIQGQTMLRSKPSKPKPHLRRNGSQRRSLGRKQRTRRERPTRNLHGYSAAYRVKRVSTSSPTTTTAI